MIKFDRIKVDVLSFIPDFISFCQKTEDIELTYLFGSYTTGEVTPLSDLDIGLLLREGIKDSFRRELGLMSDISSLFRTDGVDVIFLNSAPLYVRLNIIRTGELLYARSHDRRIDYECYVAGRYWDDKKLWDEYDEYVMVRARSGINETKYREAKDSLELSRELHKPVEGI